MTALWLLIMAVAVGFVAWAGDNVFGRLEALEKREPKIPDSIERRLARLERANAPRYAPAPLSTVPVLHGDDEEDPKAARTLLSWAPHGVGEMTPHGPLHRSKAKVQS